MSGGGGWTGMYYMCVCEREREREREREIERERELSIRSFLKLVIQLNSILLFRIITISVLHS